MSIKAKLKQQWPLLLTLVLVSASFFYGWYLDTSTPQGGIEWADQTLYTQAAQKLHNGSLPTPFQMTYAVGYPLMGAVGAFFSYNDPFVVVSYILLLLSVTLSFVAVRKLLNAAWAIIFIFFLFAWDLHARTFHTASELFAVPWNNQVLFFAFAFYFWLFATQVSKPLTTKLLVIAGLVGGVTLATREESIIFSSIALGVFLFFAKASWKQWLVVGVVGGLSFMPQLMVKNEVLGSFTASGRENSYANVRDEYLQPGLLYRNFGEVIVNSRAFIDEPLHPIIERQCKAPGSCASEPGREALLYETPWLWLSPIGIVLILAMRRYPLPIKIFTVLSLCLLLFYLSGANMSAQKLKFHTIRYITPSFIALNFAVVVAVREGLLFANRQLFNDDNDTSKKKGESHI